MHFSKDLFTFGENESVCAHAEGGTEEEEENPQAALEDSAQSQTQGSIPGP